MEKVIRIRSEKEWNYFVKKNPTIIWKNGAKIEGFKPFGEIGDRGILIFIAPDKTITWVGYNEFTSEYFRNYDNEIILRRVT